VSTFVCRHCNNTRVNQRTGKRCRYCKTCQYCRKNRIHSAFEMCNDCHTTFGIQVKR